MKRALIDQEKCLNCSECAIEINCDSSAVIREGTDSPWIDFFKCRACMKCKTLCVNGAVMEELQPCNMGMRRTW